MMIVIWKKGTFPAGPGLYTLSFSPHSMGPQVVSTWRPDTVTRTLVGLPSRKSDRSDENMMDRRLACLETGRSSG
jgi:hypothetical protein